MTSYAQMEFEWLFQEQLYNPVVCTTFSLIDFLGNSDRQITTSDCEYDPIMINTFIMCEHYYIMF